MNAFGNPNKPSTPITGIISFTYANLEEEDRNEKYDLLDKINAEKRRSKLVAHMTRAAELSKEYNLKVKGGMSPRFGGLNNF